MTTTTPSGGPQAPSGGPQSPPASSGVPRAFVSAGNAERYLMEADALRRRQLCAAFLHGTARGWRYRRRVWIAALAGVVVVAVVIAAIGVANAFARQTKINQQEQRRQQAVRGSSLFGAHRGQPVGLAAATRVSAVDFHTSI